MNPNPQEIKKALNHIVIHKPSGIRYKFTGYTYRIDEKTGAPKYQAELQSLKAPNGIVICALNSIEPEENSPNAIDN